MRVSIESSEGSKAPWIESDANGEFVRWVDVLPMIMAASACSGMDAREWRDQTGLPERICKHLERTCSQADQLTIGVEWSDVFTEHSR